MFKSATVLNQNIGSWNTSNANEMSYIFYFAQIFNQDLSGWCVTKIASEQTGFAISSALTNNNKPIWGTCP
jgi:surface protein|tara:strand:- start:200 stop:412 length:213 start_codon:yes stop_codon:yes gene_type:complete